MYAILFSIDELYGIVCYLLLTSPVLATVYSDCIAIMGLQSIKSSRFSYHNVNIKKGEIKLFRQQHNQTSHHLH